MQASCLYCLRRKHPLTACPLWIALSTRVCGLSNICGYPLCHSGDAHVITFCPVLNSRCASCFYRGHEEGKGDCGLVERNREIFWSWASSGWLSKHHLDPRSTSCGFFRILTISVARMVEGIGGNCGLRNMEVSKVIRMLDNYATQEAETTGLEPAFAELSVRASLQFFNSKHSSRPAVQRQGLPSGANEVPLGRNLNRARARRSRRGADTPYLRETNQASPMDKGPASF